MENQPVENDLFLNAFQYAPIGIALVDVDGAWLKVNPFLCKLLGYTEEEFLVTTIQELSHKKDLKADLEYVIKILAGEMDSYQLEKRYLHKQGHMVWALLSVSLVHNRDGSPRYFISQILDISMIKMAEYKISELTDKNMSILDTIADAFYSLDEEWRFVYMNKEAEKQLGKKMQNCKESSYGMPFHH